MLKETLERLFDILDGYQAQIVSSFTVFFVSAVAFSLELTGYIQNPYIYLIFDISFIVIFFGVVRDIWILSDSDQAYLLMSVAPFSFVMVMTFPGGHIPSFGPLGDALWLSLIVTSVVIISVSAVGVLANKDKQGNTRGGNLGGTNMSHEKKTFREG